ncbi:adaptin-binding domain-containing protein [Aspergillus clavatus NRRL 1]|uniref:Alpha and gamma adaptin binding protein p34 n=1 Tax=Aspergillus clavatus (strain ATCC 1007 / CBS 513.65 / DSM 816 / NCTC 3887 / NRRL 1 / QM 1276 / 107) TaxID=344612 RepID=A1CHX0_ASPCL|nr:uncharacterized protein ACLA_049470 [Aspergillus clavatus NRRL 1]EAW10475.1 conserved hypothetical protein [Aspergillus clavatus NRRL 1]
MTESPPPTSTKSNPTPKTHIRNPRRLLILTNPRDAPTTIPPLLHALTDATPDPSASFAGYTTHAPLRLANRYYTADVPIWVDEVPCARPQPQPQPQPESQSHDDHGDGGAGDVDEGVDADADAGAEVEPSTAAQWAREFSSPEARVVRDAVGAVVVCVRNLDAAGDAEEARSVTEFVGAVARVRGLIEEEREGGVGDVPGVLVLVGSGGEKQGAGTGREGEEEEEEEEEDGDLGEEGDDEPFSVGWWEDQLFEMGALGVEVVEWDPKAKGVDSERRNRYGEYQGMRRIKEILETHDWSAAAEDADGEESGMLDEDDLEAELLGLNAENGFNLEVNELEREMLGLRMAIERGGDGIGEDEDDNDDGLQVDSLEALMMRMQAIRDMSAELPEGERKKFAAKAVRDIMKEL